MATERADREPMLWLHAEMKCVICSCEWVAVYPVCAPALECPSCGYMNSRPDDDGPGLQLS